MRCGRLGSAFSLSPYSDRGAALFLSILSRKFLFLSRKYIPRNSYTTNRSEIPNRGGGGRGPNEPRTKWTLNTAKSEPNFSHCAFATLPQWQLATSPPTRTSVITSTNNAQHVTVPRQSTLENAVCKVCRQYIITHPLFAAQHVRPVPACLCTNKHTRPAQYPPASDSHLRMEGVPKAFTFKPSSASRSDARWRKRSRRLPPWH